MTTLREAAQQALTEMANARDYIWLLNEGGIGVSEEEILNKITNAIIAIHAALVEDAMQKFTDVNQELEAALTEPVQEPVCAHGVGKTKCSFCSVENKQPVQEPVAGRAFFERILAAMEGVIDVADRKTDEFDALRSCVIDLTLMLHTAPPQRKPLTDDQLDDIAVAARTGNLYDLRIAIERAHGII